MCAGVSDDLSWRVETHRLCVQQRSAEDVRMVALEPRRGVGDQRKRVCVALRESVTAEALQLAERLFREVPFIALGDHAGDQLVAKLRDPSGMFERCHRTAKLVSFARSETGAD